jgi:phosphoglycolate phosphatase-like HAD superfamily hydrolase
MMPTIAWDVDDVLNDLMRAWLAHWLRCHPGCTIRYADLKKNPPHRLLGISLTRYRQSLDAFRLSGAYGRLRPNAEVLRWFRRHGARFRHLALTAVPVQSAPVSAQWVFKHFGKWIRTYHIVPSPRPGQSLPQYDITKSDFLQWLAKADVMVEDSRPNIAAARAAGVCGILVPRPWNNGTGTLHDALARLSSVTHRKQHT